MVFKRKHKALGMAILMVLALSACSESKNSGGTGENSDISNQEMKSAERPKISVLAANAYGFTPNVSNWDDNIYVKKLEELTGTDLKIEFMSGTDYETQLSLRFASKELADLVYTTRIDSPAHSGAVEQGAIWELNELIDKYGPNLKAKIPEAAWKSPDVSKNGKIYAIPAVVPHPHTTALYIREDWLKKLNMSMPKTLDDWLAYFEGVKKEYNAYGFMVRENFSSSTAFFYEFGVMMDYWVKQGDEFVPSVITPNMKDAMTFWRKLYKNGYIPPNAFTNKFADWQAGIVNGKAGSWLHFVDNLGTFWAPSMFVGQPDAKPTIVEPPVGPKGQGLGLANPGLYYAWIIPKSVKDPERIIKFLDANWGNPEVQKFISYGIEGYNYEVVDGKIKWDPESPNNVKDPQNPERTLYQINMNFTGHSINNNEQVKMSPFAEPLMRGFDISEKYKIKNEAMYMPVLEAFKKRPELMPNFGNGDTLLADMFAKVLTSDVDIDSEFDKFVKEWRSRGGDEAIKQATEWHKQFYGN
ncbi:extracellular solute-binding protein [Paenibacillus contaminans]|uniref:ABC transporter substrate-binding protein n=1 Tax=Paenibacillus contaminans TaxID=450362 RepID=A0A329MHT9_9BACL|nr:extracellular solute-binding protein [Paenibacillus contaminans]RAV19242.1 hypothetical protein DQG23_22160 [Paenibacillus contaminans]